MKGLSEEQKKKYKALFMEAAGILEQINELTEEFNESGKIAKEEYGEAAGDFKRKVKHHVKMDIDEKIAKLEADGSEIKEIFVEGSE